MSRRSLNLAEPWYVVGFRAQRPSEPYSQTVSLLETASAYLRGTVTLPLGFDKRLAAVLPALWYCLHLPRTRFDFGSIPAKALKEFQRLHQPHRIVLFPLPWERGLPPLLNHQLPKIVLVPDDLLPDAQLLARQLQGVVDVVGLSQISPSMLRQHWEALRVALRTGAQRFVRPGRLTLDTPLRSAVVPMRWVVRQLRGGRDEDVHEDFPSQDELLGYFAHCQAVLSAVARFEAKRVKPEDAKRLMPTTLEEERSRFLCPVAVVTPGVSARSSHRELEKAINRARRRDSPDRDLEQSVMEFLVAHRACSRNGMAFLTKAIPDEAFTALHQLERAWSAHRPQVQPIRRLLSRIGGLLGACFSEAESAAMLHASSLTAFSEFPVGLAILPGGTAPLGLRVPISYRPLLPLTGALQFELESMPTIFLRGRLRVLVVECIPPSDRIGRLSRAGWRVSRATLSQTEGVECDFVEVQSAADIRAALGQKSYDILLLSAHGTTDGNRTGIQCGTDNVFGEELGPLPTIVCMSACSVSPRGQGTVNITDLMFRQGARVILGTLTPVDVRRNAVLMTRLFVNIAEAVLGRLPQNTFEAVWHFTQGSNAINDVLGTSARFACWAQGTSFADSVIAEFMLRRSAGRLRKNFVYDDTEQVLREIARDRGAETTVRAWLASPGYIPESLAYVVLGWPDRIMFYDAAFEQADKRFGPRTRAWLKSVWPEIVDDHPQ